MIQVCPISYTVGCRQKKKSCCPTLVFPCSRLIQYPIIHIFKSDEMYKFSLWDTALSVNKRQCFLTEDTMMCSKTVTCNESKCVMMNSVKGLEHMGLLDPCKSHHRSRILINSSFCTVGSSLFKVRRCLFLEKHHNLNVSFLLICSFVN